MEFFDYKNKIAPEPGRILVSEPYLNDPNFERSIILLCEHNNEGSLGFVLNKPSASKLFEIISEIKKYDGFVYIGGPVQQDSLHFIHRCGDLEGSIELCEGIYWGGDFEQLTPMIERGEIGTGDIKFFLGYSGWSAEQLDEELKINSWIVSNAVTEELLFETKPGEMWKSALKNMGGRFSIYSNYPLDPRMN